MKIVHYGDHAAIECLLAWILVPALATPGEALANLRPDTDGGRTLKNLQDALFASKKDREIRENLVWESPGTDEGYKRASEFFHDLAAIGLDGTLKNSAWQIDVRPDGITVLTAAHIQRA